MNLTSMIAYGFCVAAMIFIGRFELRSDDTGVVVGFVLIMTGILGALAPSHAWRWALASLCVPIAELIWGKGTLQIGTLLGIAAFVTVVGLAGSYSGALLRKAAFG